MRTGNSPDGQKRSFIEEARREQIIGAAVETIAEHGYGNASLARIAEREGISKGVISYHFKGKDELIEEVVQEIFQGIVGAVIPRVMAAGDPRESLREHITAVGEYMYANRSQVIALSEIFFGARTAEGQATYGGRASEPLYEGVERYFTEGQESGIFRSFDPRAMAVTLQSSLDGAFAYWVMNPEHDLTAHIAELAEVMDRAVLVDPA